MIRTTQFGNESLVTKMLVMMCCAIWHKTRSSAFPKPLAMNFRSEAHRLFWPITLYPEIAPFLVREGLTTIRPERLKAFQTTSPRWYLVRVGARSLDSTSGVLMLGTASRRATSPQSGSNSSYPGRPRRRRHRRRDSEPETICSLSGHTGASA
jgi:hypothetical protein